VAQSKHHAGRSSAPTSQTDENNLKTIKSDSIKSSKRGDEEEKEQKEFIDDKLQTIGISRPSKDDERKAAKIE
jgi:hypothetical protein